MNKYKCLDCKQDTSPRFGGACEFYMVLHEIWEAVVPEGRKGGMLCIGCLEKRMGRQLTSADFLDCPLNTPAYPHPKSQRLQEALNRQKENKT